MQTVSSDVTLYQCRDFNTVYLFYFLTALITMTSHGLRPHGHNSAILPGRGLQKSGCLKPFNNNWSVNNSSETRLVVKVRNLQTSIAKIIHACMLAFL